MMTMMAIMMTMMMTIMMMMMMMMMMMTMMMMAMMMMTAWDNWRAQAPISQWGLGAHKTPPEHGPPSI